MQRTCRRGYRLSETLAEAYRTWAERLELYPNAKTTGRLKIAPKTKESNVIAIGKLTAVFGLMPIATLEPQHAYQYIDKRSEVTVIFRTVARVTSTCARVTNSKSPRSSMLRRRSMHSRRTRRELIYDICGTGAGLGTQLCRISIARFPRRTINGRRPARCLRFDRHSADE